jgi:uncharacterized damage-inducible protein DinB
MKTHFAMMASYNAWANARYPQSSSRRGSHLDAHRLTGLGDQPDQLNAIIFDDLSSLHVARVEEDSRIIGFLQSLAEPAFEEVLDYRMLNGALQRQPRREILAHLFNHQTHHRGQAHVILTVLGVTEPDPLDLLIMQRDRASL